MDVSLFLVFLQKNPWHMMLFGTAVVTGGMLMWPLVSRMLGGSTPQVGPTEAVQLINRRDALVLDVRDAASFSAGHITNARNIPAPDLKGRLREIEKFRGDGRIAAFRTAEDAKAQLTAEQREKLKALWAARWQRRGSGEGGAEETAAAEADE